MALTAAILDVGRATGSCRSATRLGNRLKWWKIAITLIDPGLRGIAPKEGHNLGAPRGTASTLVWSSLRSPSGCGSWILTQRWPALLACD
jgi:hypothetical protein